MSSQTVPPPTLSVRPMGEKLGAEIRGIDLSVQPDSQAFAAVQQTLHRYGVIFFAARNCRLTTSRLSAAASGNSTSTT